MLRLNFLIAVFFIANSIFAGTDIVLPENYLSNCNQVRNQKNMISKVEVTFTAILPSGEKMIIQGFADPEKLLELDGQTFEAPGKSTNNWVSIPIYYDGGNGNNGLINWYGPGDEPFWSGGLHQFLLEILRNL